jgi:hypothetical protein
VIVPLTHHLLALIARDAPALQKFCPPAQAGAEYFTGPSARRQFQDDLQQFAAACQPTTSMWCWKLPNVR